MDYSLSWKAIKSKIDEAQLGSVARKLPRLAWIDGGDELGIGELTSTPLFRITLEYSMDYPQLMASDEAGHIIENIRMAMRIGSVAFLLTLIRHP